MGDVAETELFAHARAFADEVLAPGARDFEKAGRLPAEAFLEAGRRGLTRLFVPAARGGPGLGAGGAGMRGARSARMSHGDRAHPRPMSAVHRRSNVVYRG